MKIAIKPFKQFVPGRGMLACSQVNVTVGHYELGGSVRGNYELLAEVPPATPEAKPKEIIVASGHSSLTPEQMAQWAADDTYFARTIATNAGLELA